MSKTITSSHPIVLDLLRALGIDIKTTSAVDIRIAVGEPVVITQTRYVREPEALDISSLDSNAREYALNRFKRETVHYRLEKIEP